MKTNLLITHLNMGFGGVETQLLSLIDGLDKDKCFITLALCQLKGENLKLVPDNVNVCGMDCETKYPIDLLLTFRLRLLIKKIRPDICLCFHPAIGIETYFAARMVSKKLPVMTTFPGHVSSGRLDFIRKSIYKRQNRLIAVSTGVKEGLQDTYHTFNNVVVIPNCSDGESVQKKACEPVEQDWFTQRDGYILVTVGRLIESKGIDFLIDVVIYLRRELSVKLMIIGDGPEKEKLLRHIQENQAGSFIQIIGYQPNPHKFVAKSDVFIFGSKSEGLPTVLIDAMFCNTPIVTTYYKGGIEDLILDGETGIIVYHRDVEKMCDAIKKMLTRKSLNLLVAQKAFRHADNKLSKRSYIGKYEDLFNSLKTEWHSSVQCNLDK